MEDLVRFYQENGIRDITVRGDSAFGVPKLYALMEAGQVKYFVKLKSNASLQKMVSGMGKRGISQFAELGYRAKSWDAERRVVACIDWVRNGKQQELFPTYSFVVTNDASLSAEEVFSMYNGRATMEKSIEEAKNGFDADHLSHGGYKTNAVRFQIHMLAMQLVQLFRKFSFAAENADPPKDAANPKRQDSAKVTRKFKKAKVGRKRIRLPDVSTLRKRIFSVPARIVRTGRKICCKCASGFVFQDLFGRVLNVIQNLEVLIL